jgi:hypothetical protein
MRPNLPPKPASLSIGKIRQALTNAHAIHSGKSVEEIQKDYDLLQPPSGAATPLCPEELASIVSGSASLLAANGDSGEDDHGEREGHTNMKDSEGGNTNKQKVLQDRMRERNEQYKASKDHAERHMALHHSDEMEGEGLQIFRKAYQNWANEKVMTPIGGSGKCSTPLSAKERHHSSGTGTGGSRSHSRSSKI